MPACDSCGDEAGEAELDAVRRVYVTPEAWDAEGRAEVCTDQERWCFPCRSLYPHQPYPYQEVGSPPDQERPGSGGSSDSLTRPSSPNTT